jgi:hypothetical protein
MFPGFPPPDHAIRDLLTQNDGETVYFRMLHFFSVLFEKTTSLITNELKAKNRSQRITKFMEFMSEGQTGTSVGVKRQNFYENIAAVVESVSRIYVLNFIFLHLTEGENG